MKGVKAILFDFDGTLLDNFHAVYETVNGILSRYHASVLTKTQFREKVSLPFTIHSVGLSGIPEKQLKSAYLEIYQRHMPEVRLFQDVRPAVRKLRSDGLLTGVVTDEPRFLFLKSLEATELQGYFDAIVCGDDTREGKPSPLPLLQAIRKLDDVQRGHVLYVGDMAEDIVAARRARILSCAIYRRGRNFHTLARLRSAGPSLIITSLTPLKRLVRRRKLQLRPRWMILRDSTDAPNSINRGTDGIDSARIKYPR